MENFFWGKEQERDIYSSEVTNIPLLFLGRVRNFFLVLGMFLVWRREESGKIFPGGKGGEKAGAAGETERKERQTAKTAGGSETVGKADDGRKQGNRRRR